MSGLDILHFPPSRVQRSDWPVAHRVFNPEADRTQNYFIDETDQQLNTFIKKMSLIKSHLHFWQSSRGLFTLTGEAGSSKGSGGLR